MFEKLKSIANRWFKNQATPSIRHEFPLLDITDNLHNGEDSGALGDENTANPLIGGKTKNSSRPQ
jgi:hypothetical protein